MRCLSDGKKNTIIQSFSTVEEWLNERPSISPSLVMVLCFAERTQAEVERDVALLEADLCRIPVIVLSDREDARSVLSALDKGARGYIPTSMAFEPPPWSLTLSAQAGDFRPAHAHRIEEELDRKFAFTLRSFSERPFNRPAIKRG